MKTTKLPSVENLTKDWGMLKDLPNDLIDYDKYRVEDVQDLLTQDRNQTYTRLVEGIEVALKRRFVTQPQEYKDSDANVWREGYNQALEDVQSMLECVYGTNRQKKEVS